MSTEIKVGQVWYRKSNPIMLRKVVELTPSLVITSEPQGMRWSYLRHQFLDLHELADECGIVWRDEHKPEQLAPPSPRQTILDQVAAAVLRDRNATHGEPEDSFGIVAEYWETYLKHRPPGPLNSKDAAIMLGLLKTARLTKNQSNADSWVDAAGYAVCGGGIALREETK